ncbi:MAG: hypothetical protein ABW043_16950 [Devosia sp.]|uniref:hypothetical protein n=1 Tax=Devosia sp. TaxID=1871048 RepID=UPI003394F8BD
MGQPSKDDGYKCGPAGVRYVSGRSAAAVRAIEPHAAIIRHIIEDQWVVFGIALDALNHSTTPRLYGAA